MGYPNLAEVGIRTGDLINGQRLTTSQTSQTGGHSAFNFGFQDNAEELLTGILAFDWYADSQHLVYTRPAAEGSGVHELCLIDLNTRRGSVLHRGPHIEPSASKDGIGITYLSGPSQFSQNLFLLRLEPRASPPMQLTNAMNGWYPRNGGWSSDSKSVIYVREQHEGDIYLIENYR